MTWGVRYYLSEVKRVFSYRMEFWIFFFGNLASQFTVAYFLWKSIYSHKAAVSMQGFSFGALMAYYLLAPLMERLVQGGETGQISRDIYEGGLSKYLVYPVSFFGAKFMTHLAQSSLSLLQLFAVLAVLAGALGLAGQGMPWTPWSWGLCFLVLLMAIAVQFAVNACLEQLAFWVDNVWSLSIMMRMILHLAGGSMVPLAFFPPDLEAVFRWLPFHCFIDLPTRLLLGRAGADEALHGLWISAVWALGLGALARWLWHRGLLRYSGAGM